MFEVLSIFLREGLEIVLMLGIILVYLERTGRSNLKKYSYTGLVVAIIASIITAILLNSIKSEFSKITEAIMFFITAFLVFTLIVWFHYGSKHLTKGLGRRIEKSVTGWQSLGVFLLTFIIVFREGAEIVLMLMAFEDTQKIVAYTESIIGILIVIILGYLIIKRSLKINLNRFFKLTTIMLWIIFFELILHGILELIEAGIIAAPGLIIKSLEFLFDGVGKFMISGILLILIILMLWDILRHK